VDSHDLQVLHGTELDGVGFIGLIEGNYACDCNSTHRSPRGGYRACGRQVRGAKRSATFGDCCCERVWRRL
jgi:hypothetical protein